MERGVIMTQQVMSKDSLSSLLEEFALPEGTEFVCTINRQGRIEEEQSIILKDKINMTKEKKEMFAMGVQLQNSMQSDFDCEFGAVHYTITEREGARFVSMPIPDGILLAKIDKSVDPFAFADKMMVNFSLPGNDRHASK